MKRYRHWFRFVAPASLGVFGVMLPAVALGQQVWLGTTSSAWSTGANWSGGVEPTAGDAITINSGSTPYAPTVTQAGEVGGALTIGDAAGQSGSLNVNGAGQLIINGLSSSIGNYGSAAVTISSGGKLTTGDFTWLAREAGSLTTAIITGEGSSWESDGFFIIGTEGRANVSVSSGAHLTVGESLTVAWSETSESSLSVTGEGSELRVAEFFTIGQGGKGTVTVSDGAYVKSGGLDVGAAELRTDLGGPPGPVTGVSIPGDGTFTATGAGTRVDLDQDSFQSLGVGADGSTGVLNILDGAVLTVVGRGHLAPTVINGGYTPSAAFGNGTMTVSGAGSKASFTSTMDIGEAGTGVLNVLAGGYVSNGSAYIGSYKSATADGKGTVNVDGAGSTWVTNGSVRVGDEGLGAVNITNGGKVTSGTIYIAGSGAGSNGTVTIDGAQSLWEGSSTLTISPGGTALLLLKNGGTMNVDGATSIGANGTLKFGDNSAAGVLATTAITNNGAIVFGNTGSITVSTAISGAGTLTKNGLGTAILAAVNGYTGATTINAGHLNINGSLTDSAVTINAGGYLGGNGEVGAVMVNAGGRIAPGNSIDTLTVASADFAAGSILEVEVDDAGGHDLLQVEGTATIDDDAGVHVVPVAGTYAVGQQYLILDAGTRSGSFGGVTDSSAFLQFELDQSIADQVWLRVLSITDFAAIGGTPNQMSTAAALQDLGAGDPLFDVLAPLSADEAPAAFDQLSGEIYATTLRALVDESRHPREAALDRVDAAFDAIAQGELAQWGRNVWARSYGGIGTVDGNGNAAAFDTVGGGLLVGADGLVNSKLFLGALGGVGFSEVDVEDRNSSASVSSFHLGLYGGADLAPVSLKFGGVVTANAVGVERDPTFSGFDAALSADTGSLTGQLFGEVGYAFELGEARLTPFLRGAVIGTSAMDYDEGSGDAALSGHADAYGATILMAGLRGSTDFTLGDGMAVHATGAIGLQRVLGDAPATTHAFEGGTPFTIVGASVYDTALVLEGGLSGELAPGVSLDLSYSGQFGGEAQSQTIKATLSGKF